MADEDPRLGSVRETCKLNGPISAIKHARNIFRITLRKAKKLVDEECKEERKEYESRYNRPRQKMNVSEFYWNSSLSDERKQEMADWYNGLSAHEQEMVDDFRQDAVDDERFCANEAD